MKKLLTVFALGLFTLSYSQFEGSKQIYEAPNLKEKIKEQKTVAIIPFDVKNYLQKTAKEF